ncbi:T9SS type A sorting domain-containing protein [Echinicola marina]|uniref:T9SS type A sorting domain-containing protein n=1 Tax=Echinicola marina TaxID=2859768 RepID=UPI001CF67F9F|nr:T9SS type A sorting domain-containing protein [Echinicola marina]UCS94337.1 T9SS type A sorting domain-containing protein [Echinicola marina]
MKIIYVLFSLLLGTSLFGQTQFMEDLISRYDNLEPYVDSGILIDRNPQSLLAGPSNYSPLKFDGSPGSYEANNKKFEDLYELFYYASYNSIGLFNFHPDEYKDRLELAMYGTKLSDVSFEQSNNLNPISDFVMGSLLINYEEITSMAWDSSYIAFDTVSEKYFLNTELHLSDTVYTDSTDLDQYMVMDTTAYRSVQETIDRSFQNRFLFVLGALNDLSYVSTTQVTFSFPPELFISNQASLSNFKIDFGDGNGYRSLPSQTVTITYPDFGTYTVKMILHDNCIPVECLSAKTKITLVELKQGEPDDTWFLPQDLYPECHVSIEEGIGIGRADIFYRDGAGSEEYLRKPLILVEGFESARTESRDNDKCDGGGCGGNNWQSFTTGEFKYGDLPQLAKAPVMIDSLLANGYDVIYFDIKSNRRQIEKNGNLLINLIQKVNQELKQNSSQEEIVVVAASMGSLIGRYAIRKIEMFNCCHNVRTYLSFDGPHRGANIPLGLQEFVYALGDDLNALGKGDPAKETYDRVLNSDAARQMLVYHRDPTAAAERQNFKNLLSSMGMPQNCRRVAVINGSERGLGQYEGVYDPLGNNHFLHENEPILELVISAEAPVAVPDVVKPVLSIASVLGTPSSGGIFPLLYAKAYTIGNTTGTTLNQVELERGRDFNANLLAFGLQFTQWLIGTTAFILNLIAHGVAFIAALAAALGACIVCPFIAWSKIKTSAIIAGTWTAILVTLLQIHQDQNPNSDYTVFSDHHTLPYDNAPGSNTSTPKDIAELSDGLANAYFPHHSFMASVSALDIDTNELFINISDLSPLATGLTTFDSYYAPIDTLNPEVSPNEMHVEITDANIAWTLSELKSSQYGLNDPGNPKFKQLSEYYNFARPNDLKLPFEKFIKNVHIVSNGSLNVNNYGDISYQGSNVLPSQYSHFVLKTDEAFCDSIVVRIKNGGEFNIGDNNYSTSGASNSAEMYFRSGSKLIVENGGTLRIHDNSILVIENGADIILHPGANIILDRSNSILEIQGKLILKQNTVFSPSGNGFVRFNQGMTMGTANQFIVCEGNNEMHFTGNGKNNKRLEIASNTFFTSALDYVKIENVKVELNPSKFLGVHAPFKTWYSKYTRVGNNSYHNGLRIYGQSLMDIRYCDFEYGENGLSAILSTYGNPLNIWWCTFSNCSYGLKTQGKRTEIRHSSFLNNSTGWLALDKDGMCISFKNNFEYNTNGIDFIGQEGSGLKLSHSTFDNNSNDGARASGTNLWSFCCSYTDNGTGLYLNNSFGWLNNHSQNNFDNTLDIFLAGAEGLNVNYGYNTFEGTSYIEGDFSSNAASSLYYDAQNDKYYLEVKNNLMPAGGTIVPVDITIDGNPVGLRDWGTPAAYPTACENMEIETPSTIPDELETEIIIPDEGGNRILNEALIYAVGFIESQDIENADDNLTAMQILRTTMNHVKEVARYGSSEPNNIQLPLLTTQEQRVMDLAFDFYMLALSNAYRFEVLEPNRAESEQSVPMEIDYIIDEAEFRLEYQAPDASDPYLMEFHYNLAQSHAFRIGEYYDYALNKLIDAQQWAEGRELEIAEYWQCVYEAEADLILENIDAEQFLDMIMNCRLTAPAYKKSPSPHGSTGVDVGDIIYSEGDDKDEITLTLQPNPTRSLSTLSVHGSHPEMTIQVYSNTGALVHRGMIEENQKEYLLNLDVKPGVYHVHISYRGKNEVIKWIIAK